MNKHVITGVAVVVTTLSAWFGTRQSGGGGQSSSPRPVPPPVCTQGQIHIKTSAHPDNKLAGHATLDTTELRVNLTWLFERNQVDVTSTQALTVGFWPTTAVWANDRFYVAGKTTDSGDSVIQEWDFIHPAQIPVPGEAYKVQVVRRVLLRDENLGPDSVRFLTINRGFPEDTPHLFAHFWGNGDVYDLDVTNSSMNILFQGAQEPALMDEDYTSIMSGEHPSIGYVYSYNPNTDYIDHSDPLIMLDSDKDGLIDSIQVVTFSEWGDLLGSPKEWVQLYD